jgi:hypothetical protein
MGFDSYSVGKGCQLAALSYSKNMVESVSVLLR